MNHFFRARNFAHDVIMVIISCRLELIFIYSERLGNLRAEVALGVAAGALNILSITLKKYKGVER